MFLHHFVHIPWTQPDAWRVLPADMREDLYEGILSNDIIAFHTRSYRRNFLLCCRELFDLEVDEEAGVVRFEGRDVWVRAYPLPISAETFRQTAQRPAVHEYEREILRRRREHLILRVDRADLSKNVLRGFTAFDLFLEQHPEFKEKVTFIAHLIPSRQDVPEYAEYLERIEALVAVVNHRHGTTDWMPIDLRLRENLEEAIAAYKHYDLLMVNAMFDGMNLIAKEGPLVNERNGVSLLSENTGAHEELADFALWVNPFDVQEQADAIYRALTMSAEERSWRAQGLKRIVTARDPGDWVDDQLADIEAKRHGEAAGTSARAAPGWAALTLSSGPASARTLARRRRAEARRRGRCGRRGEASGAGAAPDRGGGGIRGGAGARPGVRGARSRSGGCRARSRAAGYAPLFAAVRRTRGAAPRERRRRRAQPLRGAAAAPPPREPPPTAEGHARAAPRRHRAHVRPSAPAAAAMPAESRRAGPLRPGPHRKPLLTCPAPWQASTT